MIALLVLAAYVVGWFVFTVKASRFAVEHEKLQRLAGYCHGDGDYSWNTTRKHFHFECDIWHGRNGSNTCWRTDDEEITLTTVLRVSAAGLGWPILMFPLAAYVVANHKPTPALLARQAEEQHRYIEQLERAAGIK